MPSKALLERAKTLASEISSARLASIAARGLKTPSKLSAEEVRSLAASVLTQREYPGRTVMSSAGTSSYRGA
jgi:hypothetical protein